MCNAIYRRVAELHTTNNLISAGYGFSGGSVQEGALLHEQLRHRGRLQLAHGAHDRLGF